ncbi:MAG: substrate-binding domain-containing protein [Thaumarchaeota archaeon]|nr:substrate-binding domain-containing protein [Nitrososphaerota archaeon]
MQLDRLAVSTPVIAVSILVVVAASIGAYSFYRGSAASKLNSPLIVYSADLYTAESSFLYSGFANSTGIPYAPPKGAGSFALARQIAQGSPVSDFVSVSKSALETSYLGNRSSGWGVAFAADQMSIGYSNSTGQPSALQTLLSEYQEASVSNSTSPWKTFFSDLTSGSVKVGISNPNTDPAGYRAWIVLEAAGQVYAGDQTYFVNRMLQSGANVTGASAAALVAPLQAGQIQLLFMYKSAVQSHGLATLLLSSQVNLGDAALGNYYSQFMYNLSAGPQKGGPILLFITVPRNSTETSRALEFVVYVVQQASTMSGFGLVPLSPPQLYNSTAVPSIVAQLLTDGSVVRSGSI